MTLVLLWALCLSLSVPVAMLALECFVGIAGRRPHPNKSAPPPFTVLMPAHNEAADIAQSVADVLTQLRGCDRLLVVADNCDDNTAALARDLGASVIERSDPGLLGKGYALEFGRAALHDDPAEVIVVVDADCSPAPNALRQIAATAAANHAVVQGAYQLKPAPDSSTIVRISCFAFLVKNLVRQVALARLSDVALLQGSGMAFPRAIFDRVRWKAHSLVEDLEMGLDILLEGDAVLFDEAAGFVSPASTQSGTVQQRRRWEHGMLQVMAGYMPRLLAAALRGRAHLLIVALDLMIPPTVLLILIAGVVTVPLIALVGFAPPVVILLAAEAALAVGLVAVWFARGRALLPPRALRTIVPYVLWKSRILSQFFTSRQRQWIRTERKP